MIDLIYSEVLAAKERVVIERLADSKFIDGLQTVANNWNVRPLLRHSPLAQFQGLPVGALTVALSLDILEPRVVEIHHMLLLRSPTGSLQVEQPPKLGTDYYRSKH